MWFPLVFFVFFVFQREGRGPSPHTFKGPKPLNPFNLNQPPFQSPVKGPSSYNPLTPLAPFQSPCIVIHPAVWEPPRMSDQPPLPGASLALSLMFFLVFSNFSLFFLCFSLFLCFLFVFVKPQKPFHINHPAM